MENKLSCEVAVAALSREIHNLTPVLGQSHQEDDRQPNYQSAVMQIQRTASHDA